MMRKYQPSGFTLIEVIISLVILSVLTVLTTQSIRNGIQSKQMLNNEIERDSQLADALRVMKSDLELAFHHRDIFTKMYNEILQGTPPPGTSPGAPTPFPTPAPPPVAGASPAATPKPIPIDVTGFVGDAKSMYFTTLSNVRTQKDVRESNEAKVGYFLKTCQSRSLISAQQKTTPSQCLVRTLSPFLDDDVTKTGPETVLVENVKEFKLRYLGPGHDDYVEEWKTGKNGDVNSKDNFPYAVEITLAIQDKADPKSKPVASTIVAALRFTNNPPSPTATGGAPLQ